MTQCTGIIMNGYNHLACMTACCTISVNGDRGIRQPTRRVRGMVVVTMVCTGLVCMTGGTGYRSTRCYHAGYCAGRRVVMLTVATVICVTRITVTGLVVMQRDNLGPGADWCMTVTAAAAASCLVRACAIISYIMTTVLTRMGRMGVKVQCMTTGAGTLCDRCRVGTR